MVSVPEPLLFAWLIDQIRKSVVQDGGGVSGRQLVSIRLKMIKAAVNQIVLVDEDINYLQICLIVYLQ